MAAELGTIGLGGEHLSALELGGVILRHEPDFASTTPQIAGHLHPCARIMQSGRMLRARAFAISDKTLILPATGSMTGSLNVLDKAFGGLMANGNSYVGMVGKSAVFRIASGKLLPG
jgi:uncharacterized protein